MKLRQIQDWWYSRDVSAKSPAFVQVKTKLKQLNPGEWLTASQRMRGLTPDQVDELWETSLYAQLLSSTDSL